MSDITTDEVVIEVTADAPSPINVEVPDTTGTIEVVVSNASPPSEGSSYDDSIADDTFTLIDLDAAQATINDLMLAFGMPQEDVDAIIPGTMAALSALITEQPSTIPLALKNLDVVAGLSIASSAASSAFVGTLAASLQGLLATDPGNEVASAYLVVDATNLTVMEALLAATNPSTSTVLVAVLNAGTPASGIYQGQTLPENQGSPELWEPLVRIADLPTKLVTAIGQITTDEEATSPDYGHTIYIYGDGAWQGFLQPGDMGGGSLPIAQSDVTGLVDALAGKSAVDHDHADYLTEASLPYIYGCRIVASNTPMSTGSFTDIELLVDPTTPNGSGLSVARSGRVGMHALVLTGADRGLWTITASGPCTLVDPQPLKGQIIWCEHLTDTSYMFAMIGDVGENGYGNGTATAWRWMNRTTSPWNIDLDPLFDSVLSNVGGVVADSSCIGGGYRQYENANGRYQEFTFETSKASIRFHYMHTTDSTCGTVTFYLDGVSIGTVDCYSGSTTRNVSGYIAVGDIASGKHTLRIETTATGSGGSYGMNLQKLFLRRYI